MTPVPFQSPGQFVSEQDVGQLSFSVDPSPAILAFRLKIIELDGGAGVDLRRNVHDSGGGIRLEYVHQQAGEMEIGQVIDGKLHLQPILRELSPARDHCRVVEEDMQLSKVMLNVSGQFPYSRRV